MDLECDGNLIEAGVLFILSLVLFNSYNGNFNVLKVISETKFTYRMLTVPNPDMDADPANPPTAALTFRARWQIRRLVYEGNICELVAYDQAASSTLPTGISSDAYRTPPPFTFPGAVFRGNFFRLVDNAPMKDWNNGSLIFSSPVALGLGEFQNTLVEQNVIELSLPWAINYSMAENITAFSNLSPNGMRRGLYDAVQPGGVYQPKQTVDDKIAGLIEEAVVCSML